MRRTVLVEGARGHPQLQMARPRVLLVKLQRLQFEGHDLVATVAALELALDLRDDVLLDDLGEVVN